MIKLRIENKLFYDPYSPPSVVCKLTSYNKLLLDFETLYTNCLMENECMEIYEYCADYAENRNKPHTTPRKDYPKHQQ